MTSESQKLLTGGQRG